MPPMRPKLGKEIMVRGSRKGTVSRIIELPKEKDYVLYLAIWTEPKEVISVRGSVWEASQENTRNIVNGHRSHG